MSYEAWAEERAAVLLAPFTSDETMVLVALQTLQEQYGYVHLDAPALVARICNVSRADVHGVLTFYHELHRQPPAARAVRVCRAEACQAVGSADIESAFAAAGHPLGSHDDTLSVEAVYCFGNCALGPSVEIDGILRGRCTADVVAEVVR